MIKDRINSKVPDFPKLQFDTIEDAKNYLKNSYKLDISFYRQGWEYQVDNNTRVYLEMIQSLPPTIEVLASSKEEILNLFSKLQ